MPLVSHPSNCEEPGPDVPDDLLVGMKGLLLGPPEPFLQAETTQLPQPPLTGPVLQPPDHPDGPSTGLTSSLCFSWIKDPKQDIVF